MALQCSLSIIPIRRLRFTAVRFGLLGLVHALQSIHFPHGRAGQAPLGSVYDRRFVEIAIESQQREPLDGSQCSLKLRNASRSFDSRRAAVRAGDLLARAAARS
jgi:hypothetical protein